MKTQKLARFTGFMFLFSLFFPILNYLFVVSKLHVPENATATVDKIMSNEELFRISIVNDLLLAISAIVTAMALYALLKTINKNLALLALTFRLAEATLISIIGLFRFTLLQGFRGDDYLEAIDPNTFQVLAGFLLNEHTSIVASFPMLFIGLGLALFSYLFLKSKYIPWTIASLGILSYSLIFVYALINILVPEHSLILQSICWAPSILFELLIGVWLIFKKIE